MNKDTGATVRLFTAIDLPDEIRGSLLSLCRGVAGVRWVKPEQLHLTLRFIGGVTRERCVAIRESLASLHAPSFPLSLRGVGSFPASGGARVLWTGVEPSVPLVSLRDRIEERVVAAGCEAEGRPFSPHITLARLKGLPRHLLASYCARHAAFSAGPFAVKEFLLYSSVLTREGSIHTVEERYPLMAAPLPEVGPCSF